MKFLGCDSEAKIAVSSVEGALSSRTTLVSLQWVNNEVGSIQHIDEIAKILKDRDILFHVDATQAIGKVAIDLKSVPIDLLSFSSHKIYGPKGAGVLFVRSGARDRIKNISFGGSHEGGLRPGTQPLH